MTDIDRSPHLGERPLGGSRQTLPKCRIWLHEISKIFYRYVFGTICIGRRELILHKCSIPVFDGLFPGDHNKMVMDLLFTMAHWHGLAKLRMHSDLTLDILDKLTTDLGDRFREFKAEVCPAYQTQELDREVDARSRRQAKEASKRARKPNAGAHDNGQEIASSKQPQDVPILKQSRRRKSFNFQTYKFHSLGDYVASIRHFGTTDSYSTEPVSCSLSLMLALTRFLLGRIRASNAEKPIPSY